MTKVELRRWAIEQALNACWESAPAGETVVALATTLYEYVKGEEDAD